MKRDLLKDLENGKFNVEDPIANLVPYLLEDIPYAIPVNSSISLRKHIAAAIFKYHNPEESFEEILDDLKDEEYDDEKSLGELDEIYKLICDSTDSTNILLQDLLNTLEKIKKLSLGQYLFLYAMSRLKESFKSAIILLRDGFFVEAIPVLRLIYEQLCWGCFVIDQKDEKYISKNSTTKNTKYLKKKINEDYGQLYSLLSSDAHLDPKVISKYIESGGGIEKVRGRSAQKSKEEAHWIILLYQIFMEVLECSINESFALGDEDREYYQSYISAQKLMCKQLGRSYYKKDIKFTCEKRI